MFHLWQSYRVLAPPDRRLVREAAVFLAVVWAGLHGLGFAATRRWLRRLAPGNAGVPDRTRPPAARIGWAVAAAARRSPVTMTCLPQALAADAMLRRRGYASRLRLGVQRRGAGAAAPLDAHAWVDCDGAVVVGALDTLDDYAPLARPDGDAC